MKIDLLYSCNLVDQHTARPRQGDLGASYAMQEALELPTQLEVGAPHKLGHLTQAFDSCGLLLELGEENASSGSVGEFSGQCLPNCGEVVTHFL